MNDRLGIAWLFAALVSLFLGQNGAVWAEHAAHFWLESQRANDSFWLVPDTFSTPQPTNLFHMVQLHQHCEKISLTTPNVAAQSWPMPISLLWRLITVVAQGINRFMKPVRSVRVQGDQTSENIFDLKQTANSGFYWCSSPVVKCLAP